MLYVGRLQTAHRKYVVDLFSPSTTQSQMTTEMMPTVIGTPIEFGAGLKVMPANLSGTDAVPLIDGQTAGILQAINSFTIKQRVCIYVESTA
jgi:hypothetical protein|tara:strand:- start:112 stop:387 length:276 start_codon:yes stop_codon:yes gene_type:complete